MWDIRRVIVQYSTNIRRGARTVKGGGLLRCTLAMLYIRVFPSGDFDNRADEIRGSGTGGLVVAVRGVRWGREIKLPVLNLSNDAF